MAAIAPTAGFSAHTFSIGRVLSRTFAVISRNFVTFAALSAIAVIPQTLYSWYFVRSLGGTSATRITYAMYQGGYAPYFFGSVLVTVVLTYILQAAIVHGTVFDLNGRRPNFVDCLATGIRNVVPLIAIAILSILGIGLGLMLLVVPGIIVALMWSVAVPVRVVESTGIVQSFGRSRELTRGHKGAILGLLVLYVIAAVALDLLLRPLTGMPVFVTAGQSLNVVYTIAATALRIITTIVSTVGIASIYYELRSIKEGVGPEQLAAVFS
jgi:hypothetical protein